MIWDYDPKTDTLICLYPHSCCCVLYALTIYSQCQYLEGDIMATSTLTMRIDSDLKRQASEIAEYYGFNLSTITKAFYKQIVRDQAIPLDLGWSTEIPNEETIAAMKEADLFFASGRPAPFKTADEMIASLEE